MSSPFCATDFFSQRYYQEVIKTNGYAEVELETVDFPLKSYDVTSMRRRFLCHHQGDAFAAAVKRGEKCIVTTGFGMSGRPHLGSLSQVIKICELNKAGMTTQVVLGDLDSYNARNQPLEEALQLKEKFKSLFLSMGYKQVNGSVLRDQYGAPQVNHTAYLISKYISDKDFDEAREDISHVYEAAGVYKGWSFPMKQALTLMIADFIHLHLYEGYSHVMVMLGLEEHKYVQMARKVVDRMGLPLGISGIYGKIIKGLSGFPKMSKSLPGSAIDVESTNEEIFRLLGAPRTEEDPRENSTFLIIEQVSTFSNLAIENLAGIYQKGTDLEWSQAVNGFIESRLIPILEKWSK